jgi:hypothetical protein
MERPQRLARRHEQTSAEYYGARLTPASGSRDAKGDAETDHELFEFKHTEQLAFRLRVADWLRHRTYALLAGKRPVWEIQYTNPNGSHPRYVVVLDRDDYLALRDSHCGEGCTGRDCSFCERS